MKFSPPGEIHKQSDPLVPESTQRLVISIAQGTVAGGTLAALISYFLGQKDLALGLFGGAVLSALNLYGLKTTAEKVLKSANNGKSFFWFWNLARWGLAAAACWFFLQVSPSCLLGAGASYLWFLTVLGWVGWRDAGQKKNSNVGN